MHRTGEGHTIHALLDGRLAHVRRSLPRMEGAVMKALPSIGLAAVIALVLGFAEPRGADCDSAGNIRFICGQVGPEDLAVVPGGEWVISSGNVANGGIRLIKVRDKTSTVLSPRHRPRSGPIGKRTARAPDRSTLQRKRISGHTACISAPGRMRSTPCTSSTMAAGSRSRFSSLTLMPSLRRSPGLDAQSHLTRSG